MLKKSPVATLVPTDATPATNVNANAIPTNTFFHNYFLLFL